MNNICVNNNIYVFWTGDNPLCQYRSDSIQQLKHTTDCNIIFITKQNLYEYILPEHPLHPAYEYLSEVHKSDYLRTYFMNFYGGGYCDVKKTASSWIESFDKLHISDKWIIGYYEQDSDCIAYRPVAEFYSELIGNGAYICKPMTKLTQEWYNEMILLLDSKLDTLKQFPSTNTRDCSETSNGKYPIGWNEMLGRIFHKVCYKYKDKILNTLPRFVYY